MVKLGDGDPGSHVGGMPAILPFNHLADALGVSVTLSQLDTCAAWHLQDLLPEPRLGTQTRPDRRLDN